MLRMLFLIFISASFGPWLWLPVLAAGHGPFRLQAIPEYNVKYFSPHLSHRAHTILFNVSLMDGISDHIQYGKVIYIRHGKIHRIRKLDVMEDNVHNNIKNNSNDSNQQQRYMHKSLQTHVLDCSGLFVMSALTDGHVHVTATPTDDGEGQENQRKQDVTQTLKFALLGGITNIRDMAGDIVVLSQFIDKMKKNPQFPSPRIFMTAVMGGPSFFQQDERVKQAAHGGIPGQVSWLKAITDNTDMIQAMYEAKLVGVTGIKFYANLPSHLISLATRAARKSDLMVWSHAAVFPALPSECIKAGVDVLSHAAYLVWEASPFVPASYRSRMNGDYSRISYEAPEIIDLFQHMSWKRSILDATLFVFNEMHTTERGRLIAQWSANATRLANSLGVRVSAGTDSIGSPDKSVLPNIHREMELLVQDAKFSAFEAIQAATIHNAAALGIEEYYGTVEVGKVADLLFLRKNPLEDIRNTQHLMYVMRDGFLYDVDA